MGFDRRYIGFQLVPRFRERMAQPGGGSPAFVQHRVARAAAGAQADAEADARQSAQPLHGRGALRQSAARARVYFQATLPSISGRRNEAAPLYKPRASCLDGPRRAAVPKVRGSSGDSRAPASGGIGSGNGNAVVSQSPFVPGAPRAFATAPGVRAHNAVMGAESRRTVYLEALAPAAPMSSETLAFRVPGRAGALNADGVADAATIERICAGVTVTLTKLVSETQRKESTTKQYRGVAGLFQQYLSAIGLGVWFTESSYGKWSVARGKQSGELLVVPPGVVCAYLLTAANGGWAITTDEEEFQAGASSRVRQRVGELARAPRLGGTLQHGDARQCFDER